MLHTLTTNDEHRTATLRSLEHGDVVARINAAGEATYMRAVLRTEDGVKLGFPKRMTHDVDASFVDYVQSGKGATAKYTVVGQVTQRVADTKPKARKVTKRTKAVDSTNDAHDKLIQAKRSGSAKPKVIKSAAELSAKLVTHNATTAPKALTKAAAADVIATLADAIDAQVAALRAVAAAL